MAVGNIGPKPPPTLAQVLRAGNNVQDQDGSSEIVGPAGELSLTEAAFRYVSGGSPGNGFTFDGTGRPVVEGLHAAYVNPSGGTAADIINALITAGLMAASS
jgi:hypothetical protein